MQMKDFIKKYKLDLISIAFIGSLFFILSGRNIHLPGMYMDSVTPDYLSMQWLYPELKNTYYAAPHIGIPLITQLYHGTLATFIGTFYFSIIDASLSSFRMLNAIYGFIGILLSYILLKSITKKTFIPMAITLCLSTSISLSASFRTQLYAFLPGIVLTLGALLLLYNNKLSKNKIMIISGILAGLAFYSYFVFIFFVPAYIIVIVYKIKQEKLLLCINWLYSFCIGSVLYIVAYYEIFIYAMHWDPKIQTLMFVLFLVFLLIALIIPLIYMCYGKKTKRKYKIIYFIIVFILFLILAGQLISNGFDISLGIQSLKSQLTSLDVIGNKTTFLERIRLVIYYALETLTNSTNEINIFRFEVSRFNNFLIIIFLLISLITLLICVKFRKVYLKEINNLMLLINFPISFIIVSIIFSTRLGGHHYIAILYFYFIICGLEINIIYNVIQSNFNFNNKYIKRIGIIILGVVVIYNLINQEIFNEYLKKTGGVGYYTNQVNELAYKALEDKVIGSNDVYVFPEWGFMFEFCFLTKNSIPYTTSLDEEYLLQLREKYDKLIFCYWNEDDTEKYEEIAAKLGALNNKTWYTLDGKEAFYTIETKN